MNLIHGLLSCFHLFVAFFFEISEFIEQILIKFITRK